MAERQSFIKLTELGSEVPPRLTTCSLSQGATISHGLRVQRFLYLLLANFAASRYTFFCTPQWCTSCVPSHVAFLSQIAVYFIRFQEGI